MSYDFRSWLEWLPGDGESDGRILVRMNFTSLREESLGILSLS